MKRLRIGFEELQAIENGVELAKHVRQKAAELGELCEITKHENGKAVVSGRKKYIYKLNIFSDTEIHEQGTLDQILKIAAQHYKIL